jgi:hypothetical protein
MIYLIISILSSFPWYPISMGGINNVYEFILNSDEGSLIISRYGGEEYLMKKIIRLNGDIFSSGVKILLLKEYKIEGVPENLQAIKRPIKMKKYNRFSAIYKEGELKEEWNELVSKSEDELEISSLTDLSLEDFEKLLPEKISTPEKEIKPKNDIEDSWELKTEGIKTYPRKHYFSFILIEENFVEKLVPVILNLSPIDEVIQKLENTEEG